MSFEKDLNPNLRNLRSRPLCIICGRPGEAEEIAKALGIFGSKIQGDEIEKVADGHTFYLGSFNIQKGTLDYYITSSLRQGIQSFTVSAAVLFSTLLPRFVVHAGVCAGYYDPSGKLKMNLTDVVFGEAAINYEEGKWESIPGKGVFFRPDYNRVTASAGDMQAFADSHHRPRYHYGEYISGSAVRTDAGAIFEQTRGGMNRNAIALDMEASAFIQLCGHFGNDYAKCLGVVKGISDFGNSNKGKDEDIPTEALKNTASALREWIVHRIPIVSWVIDESNEPGAKIVTGYYKNFVSRILDNFCEGMEITLKNDDSVIIPAKEIKGFKTVLPTARNPAAVSEMGNITAITNAYDIREIKIGGKQSSRYLYYKAGYMMDWARCCNSLIEYDDGVYQVGVFERELRKHHYYSAVKEGPARALICTWEETEEWLKEEAVVEKATAEKLKQEVAEVLKRQDRYGPSKIYRPPEILTQTKNITRKEQTEVQSPRSPNTFPGESSRTTGKLAGHSQDQNSNAELANLRRRLSFPQIRKLLSRKAPPMPPIQKGVQPVSR